MRRFLVGALALGFATAVGFAGTASAAQDEVAASRTVVVNEVTAIGPNGQLDEAIEIRNITNQPLDISDYVIEVYDSVGTEWEIQVADGTVLRPMGNVGQFLVLTGPNFSSLVQDATYVQPFNLLNVQGIPTTGGVAVYNSQVNADQNQFKVDGVAFSFGASPALEGQPAIAENGTTAQLEAANARNILSIDTDNNRQDFSLHQRTLGAVN
ncbi:lamin tail domain-containing protein [Amycolatopsis aidingensis]|uniref:lamin tail domain-containing protein n=1 Tax=Amycolatopsis aidingensis TaxID=2842453 RepID=UPI001C0B3339|nr:lamin tail domain-containing protein [Amycolatopsis aidingensis]